MFGVRVGGRKYLNQLEVPTYPDIKKGEPRMTKRGERRDIDSSFSMNHNTDILGYDHHILVQPRDYGERRYGKGTRRDYVNETVVMANLMDPQLTTLPLSRQPAKVTTEFRSYPRTTMYSPINGYQKSQVDGHLSKGVRIGNISAP
jgi:hypothetical protein